ncbi:hypothetical protein MBLNU230_g8547t1 [Neophaeotheca triangularis]
MSFYLVNLVASILPNVALAIRQSASAKPEATSIKEDAEKGQINDQHEGFLGSPNADRGWAAVRKLYLIVYGLAVTADWLQGSFIYSLYKHEYNLEESTISALFTTGFASGAVAAIFVGKLADQHGRRKGCLGYCLLYALSCALTLVQNREAMFLGRMLGGVSSTLLYSVFEAWLVSEAHEREDGAAHVGDTLATASTLNGAAAIACGVASQVLVSFAGSKKAPFVASIFCLGLAAVVISKYWVGYTIKRTMNFSDSIEERKLRLSAIHVQRSKHFPSLNGKVIALTLGTCAMEGSMYAFVYFWTPSLVNARGPSSPEAPLGIIFASFMCAMMLGSWICRLAGPSSSPTAQSSHMVQLALSAAASCLLVTILSEQEHVRFYAFWVFEMCVGLYYPSMASLKSYLIPDQTRGQVYSMMRLPLGLFVTLVLCTIREGDVYRQNRFTLCGALLIMSVLLVRRAVV